MRWVICRRVGLFRYGVVYKFGLEFREVGGGNLGGCGVVVCLVGGSS